MTEKKVAKGTVYKSIFSIEFTRRYLVVSDMNSLTQQIFEIKSVHTGKSLSEAFILTSTNPQYDKRLFIDLPVQYKKTTSSEHVYINCSECQNKNKKNKQFVYTTCTELVVFL